MGGIGHITKPPSQEGMPGYRAIWQLSYPVMIGLLAQNVISATDTAFLGRVGEIELGAAALGSMYYMVLFIVGFGFSIGSQIIMSRRIGEKQFVQIGPILHNTLFFFILLSTVLVIVSITFQESILQYIIKSHDVAEATGEYTSIRMYGLLFAYASTAYRGFHISRGHTKPILWNAAVVAMVNIVLDYILVFGYMGFDPMGIKGVAIASVISEGIGTLFYMLQAAHPAIRRKYSLYKWARPDMSLLQDILKVSSFVMLQYFISVATWFGFFLAIEKTGEANLASTNIVRSIYSLIGIPIWAYFSTIITLVSTAIGARRSHQVFAIVKRVGLMAVGTSLIMNCTVWFFPGEWLRIYTNDPALRELSMESLYVITFVHSCFALAGVVFNAVSGTGRTKITLMIELVTLIAYILFLILLQPWFANRVAIAWFSEWVYAFGIGTLGWIYLRKGHWDKELTTLKA